MNLTRFLVGFISTSILLVNLSLGDERIGAFLVWDDVDDAILLDSEIGLNAPLEFRRALASKPNAKLLIVSSPGGLVASGLIIADDVHRLGMGTLIPKEGGCYSACSFIFFAGVERLAEGELGVHQMSSERSDASGMQTSVSDILEALDKFDTPTPVITRMFRTPSEGMYVFTAAEIDDLEIDKLGPLVLAELSAKVTLPTVGPTIPITPTKAPSTSAPEEAPAPRLALYGGLDFYGADIDKSRVADAVQCAAACMGNRGCVAFTFNANPAAKSGPNCFLKDGIDRPEVYEDALSGLFLKPGKFDAPVFDIGGIDPTVDVEKGIDYPGNDLNTNPLRGITNVGACRMACVDNEACMVFSFASKQKQCWLKGTVGKAVRASNVTSGTKRQMSIAPIDVLDLTD